MALLFELEPELEQAYRELCEANGQTLVGRLRLMVKREIREAEANSDNE